MPVPDYARLLPVEIQRFTTKGVYDLEGETHMSFIQGAGHGGSHPHLVNEFIMSIVKDATVAERGAIGKLDVHRHLCARLSPTAVAGSSSCRSGRRSSLNLWHALRERVSPKTLGTKSSQRRT